MRKKDYGGGWDIPVVIVRVVTYVPYGISLGNVTNRYSLIIVPASGVGDK
ncbi:MAG: hypothetical protein QXF02_05285 [Candidatus Korarchaeota archaeon]